MSSSVVFSFPILLHSVEREQRHEQFKVLQVFAFRLEPKMNSNFWAIITSLWIYNCGNNINNPCNNRSEGKFFGFAH